MTTMTALSAAAELECEGRIRLASLLPGTAERLATIAGEWLEFSPEERALLVRHVQPGGRPAICAVPAELVELLGALSPAEREAISGGELLVHDRTGVVLRLRVERGDLRVEWPREDWSRTSPVGLDAALRGADPFAARVSGSVRFTAPQGAEDRLVEFIGRYEGLYPEGDLRVERQGETVLVELREVNVGPDELLATLRGLAQPATSLAGGLEVGSFVPHSLERDFRLQLEAGEARAERPSLWRDG
jgi:hypothetical protein